VQGHKPGFQLFFFINQSGFQLFFINVEITVYFSCPRRVHIPLKLYFRIPVTQISYSSSSTVIFLDNLMIWSCSCSCHKISLHEEYENRNDPCYKSSLLGLLHLLVQQLLSAAQLPQSHLLPKDVHQHPHMIKFNWPWLNWIYFQARDEKMRAQAHVKMVKKIAMTRQRLEEKQAAAEARKNLVCCRWISQSASFLLSKMNFFQISSMNAKKLDSQAFQ